MPIMVLPSAKRQADGITPARLNQRPTKSTLSAKRR
jgi:hypothetical protein